MTSRELKDMNTFNITMGYGSAREARRSARINEEAKSEEGDVDVNDFEPVVHSS